MTETGIWAAQPEVPAGRCTLSVRLAGIDETKILEVADVVTLVLTPNVTAPVVLAGATVIVPRPHALSSETGDFDFWALAGTDPAINPTGWNWHATVLVDGRTWAELDFTARAPSPPTKAQSEPPAPARPCPVPAARPPPATRPANQPATPQSQPSEAQHTPPSTPSAAPAHQAPTSACSRALRSRSP